MGISPAFSSPVCFASYLLPLRRRVVQRITARAEKSWSKNEGEKLGNREINEESAMIEEFL